MRRVVVLIAGTLLVWLLAVQAARWLGGGELTGAYATTAALLCLVPATLTLIWAEYTFRHHPEQQGLVFAGGMVLRMFFVAGTTIVLYLRVPYFRQQEGFLYWIAGFYLFVLTLETILFAAGRTAHLRPPRRPGRTSHSRD